MIFLFLLPFLLRCSWAGEFKVNGLASEKPKVHGRFGRIEVNGTLGKNVVFAGDVDRLKINGTVGEGVHFDGNVGDVQINGRIGQKAVFRGVLKSGCRINGMISPGVVWEDDLDGIFNGQAVKMSGKTMLWNDKAFDTKHILFIWSRSFCWPEEAGTWSKCQAYGATFEKEVGRGVLFNQRVGKDVRFTKNVGDKVVFECEIPDGTKFIESIPSGTVINKANLSQYSAHSSASTMTLSFVLLCFNIAIYLTLL